MVLYGLLGNREVIADFPVTPALHQVLMMVFFPARQGINRAGRLIGARLEKFGHGRNVPLGDPRLPFRNAAGALDKHLGSTVLRITPAAPLRTWRIDDSSDEEEDVATTLHLGDTSSTAGIRFSIALGENFFVDESHIGPKGFRPGHRLGGILSFTHDAEIVLHGEEFPEAKPETPSRSATRTRILPFESRAVPIL